MLLRGRWFRRHVVRRVRKAWRRRDNVRHRVRNSLSLWRRPHSEEPPSIQVSQYGDALASAGRGPVIVVRHGGTVEVARGSPWPTERQLRIITVGAGPPPGQLPPGAQHSSVSSLDMVLRVLRSVPTPAAIIEVSVNVDTSRRCLHFLLPWVGDQGIYVIDGSTSDDDRWLEIDDAELASASLSRMVSSTALDGAALTFRVRGTRLPKLRDRHVPDILIRRNGQSWGTELEHRQKRDFRSRATVTVNDEQFRRRFRDPMELPDRYVRAYNDVICVRRQLAIQGSAVLPISFHHPLRRPLWTRAAPEVGTELVEMPPDCERAEQREGVFYHLDSEFPGHFGHFMTEDLARIWGLQVARQRWPDLKVLISVDRPTDVLRPFQRTLLGALGIDEADIIVFHDPLRVQTLVGATHQLHNGRYIDPEIKQVWATIRDALAPEPNGGPARIFVSRPDSLPRRCRNASEVEAEFLTRDFTVVRPETLDMASQVALFAEADVVAGFAGSALFNCIFNRRPGTRIVIGSDQYTASNEYLISSVMGDDYHHFWCPADHQHPPGGRSRQAFHSDFTFDFKRDGDNLRRLLDSV
jgi:capsular polysaccharide biosynthesis protein